MEIVFTEIAADNTVPSRSMLLIELLLYPLSHILLYTVPLKSLQIQTQPINTKAKTPVTSKSKRETYCNSDFDCLFLHFLLHVGALDDQPLPRGSHRDCGFPVFDSGLQVDNGAAGDASLCVFTHLPE